MAGVLANDDPVAHPVPGLAIPILKHMRRCATELQGGLGGHRFDVGPTADTVGPEDPFLVRHISNGKRAKTPRFRATGNAMSLKSILTGDPQPHCRTGNLLIS